MKIKLFLIAFLFVLSCSTSKISAQPHQISPDAQVSIITCGTGDELYSVFWHTAIRFNDPSNGLDIVFNYGTFDFSTPNFYAKFVKGDLMYYLSVQDFYSFKENYRLDNRSVFEQVLNISPEIKQKLWKDLLNEYQSDAKYYQYKFIDNNCTTKVVDLLNKYLPNSIVTDFEENEGTYRKMLNTYLDNHYVEKLGINMIFGRKTDEEVSHVYLPDKLMKSLELTKINNQPLILKNNTIFIANKNNNKSFFNSIAFFLIVSFVLSAVVFLFSTFRKIIMIILATLGVFFIAVAFYSFHTEVQFNTFVLICNPMYLLLFFTKGKNNKKMVLTLLFISFLIFLTFTSLQISIILSPMLILAFTVFLAEFRNVNSINNPER